MALSCCLFSLEKSVNCLPPTFPLGINVDTFKCLLFKEGWTVEKLGWPIKKNSVSMIKSLNLGISLFPEQDAESG